MKTTGNKESKNSISRRRFITRTTSGAAGLVAIPYLNFQENVGSRGRKWPADAKKYKFHLTGQAHIDPVWLWPWSEGVSVVHSTFRSALDRMNETPGFAFTASSAQFYQWIEENDPEMLEEIRKRVSEGRWNLVGGWWVEPDMNIPSGESMVRQGLYGQLTFERLFGRKATVAFNPDSFGHTGTLPQIIKSQGMENYVFMRPGPKEKGIPADLFRWEGPDGTQVLAYRIPLSYNDTRSVRGRIEQVIELFKDQPFKVFMTYYGAGDHGGGATRENIASVLEIQGEDDAPVVIFSTPERYFSEVHNDKSLNLPLVKDDLQHHAVGCYTAESEIKKSNRIAEAALVAAEKICSVGSKIWDADYPHQLFTEAWKRILFLQFHDSLAGTSIPEHSFTAREGFGFALDTAHQAVYKALQKLEWRVPAEDPSSQYMLAFNPHAWETTTILEYDFNWDQNRSSVVEDETGKALLHQWSSGSAETGSRRKVLVKTQLPPFGYRQIRIRDGISSKIPSQVKASEKSIENEFLTVSFSSSGTIGITDKNTDNQIFTQGETGCRAVVIDDPSDTWSHDIKSFSKEIGVFGNPSIKVLEDGPLRAVARIVTTYGRSSLSIDWILNSGMQYIEAKIMLDWKEHLKMLKLSFPFNAEKPVATYEIPYGHIVRATNGDEDPGQRWIDITGTLNGNPWGLTLINDAKYGYSVNNADLRISVARSAVYAHHIPRVLDPKVEHIWQDQGIQTFRMLLVPHIDSWQKAAIPRLADEFIAPPVLIYQGIHGGKMPKSESLIEVSAQNICITCIKLSEINDDLIIRCLETSGEKTTATIWLKYAGLSWKGDFRPCEIKSLRINTITGEITEVNLLEEFIR